MSRLSAPLLRTPNVLHVGTSKYRTLDAAIAAAQAGDVIWLVDGDTYSFAANLVLPAGVHLMGSDPSQVQVTAEDTASFSFAGSNVVQGIDFNHAGLIVSGPGCDVRHNRIGNHSDLISIPYTDSGATRICRNVFYDQLYDGIRCNFGSQGRGVEVIIEENEWDSDYSVFGVAEQAGFCIGMQSSPGPLLVVRKNNVNVKTALLRIWLELLSTGLTVPGQVLSEGNRVRIDAGAADVYGIRLAGGAGLTKRYPAITCLDDLVQLVTSGTAYGVSAATLVGSTKDPDVTTLINSNYADYTLAGHGGADQQVLVQVNDQVGADATPGATVALDLSAAQIFRWTAGEAETINLSNVPAAGNPMVLLITNDDTARTITFGTGFTAVPPLIGTAGKTALLRFVSDGTNMVMTSRTTGLA